MKIALKISYDGTRFHGFAIQPNLRTIEGELTDHLEKITGEKTTIHTSSRTDQGVSANKNVVAFNITKPLKKTIYTLDTHLRDIWIRAMTPVPETFNPRHAKKRWYRYYLPDTSLDITKMKKAAQLFKGKHNYTNYTKDKTKNPCLTIDTITITRENNIYILDITAQRFLWNQIRRIIAAIKKVGNNEISPDDIKKTLKYPHKEQSFGMSPPENLILMDVQYKNINFTPITKSQKKIENIAQYYHMRAMMFKNMSTSP